jgi:CheY-like chemotaxis protein
MSASPAATLGKRTRLLLAEDDHELRSLLASALRKDGYEVLEASDGPELVDNIEATMKAPRDAGGGLVVVADVRMPGLTGLDVLMALRAARCETPVILMSAFGDEEMHAEARALGAVAVLDKPFAVDDLRMAVFKAAQPAASGL